MCSMCDSNNIEDLEHLFTYCHHARAVGITSLSNWILQYLEMVDYKKLDTSEEFKTITTGLWAIWYHRNISTFQSQKVQPIGTIQLVMIKINQFWIASVIPNYLYEKQNEQANKNTILITVTVSRVIE